jgi:hypothetical protein
VTGITIPAGQLAAEHIGETIQFISGPTHRKTIYTDRLTKVIHSACDDANPTAAAILDAPTAITRIFLKNTAWRGPGLFPISPDVGCEIPSTTPITIMEAPPTPQ